MTVETLSLAVQSVAACSNARPHPGLRRCLSGPVSRPESVPTTGTAPRPAPRDRGAHCDPPNATRRRRPTGPEAATPSARGASLLRSGDHSGRGCVAESAPGAGRGNRRRSSSGSNSGAGHHNDAGTRAFDQRVAGLHNHHIPRTVDARRDVHIDGQSLNDRRVARGPCDVRAQRAGNTTGPHESAGAADDRHQRVAVVEHAGRSWGRPRRDRTGGLLGPHRVARRCRYLPASAAVCGVGDLRG